MLILNQLKIYKMDRITDIPRPLIDCITYEEIRADRLVVITEGTNDYYFDVSTLYKHFIRIHQLINPYTMNPLPPHLNRAVRVYGELQKTVVSWKDTSVPGTFTIMVDSFLTIGDLLIEILRGTLLPVHAKNFKHLNGICSFLDTSLSVQKLDFYENLETPLDSMGIIDNNLTCLLMLHQPTLVELTKLEIFLQKRSTEPYAARLYDLLVIRQKKEMKLMEEDYRCQIIHDVWSTMRHITDGISSNIVPRQTGTLEIPDVPMMVQIILYDDPHNFEIMMKCTRCLNSKSIGPILKILCDLKHPLLSKYLEIILNSYSLNGNEILEPSIFKIVAYHTSTTPKAERNQLRILKLLLVDRTKLEIFALETIPNKKIRDFISRTAST